MPDQPLHEASPAQKVGSGAAVLEFQDLARRHRQFGGSDAERIVQGRGQRTGRRDNRGLAAAAHAVGVVRPGNLHQHRFNHRQVKRRGHAVVQQAGVE